MSVSTLLFVEKQDLLRKLFLTDVKFNRNRVFKLYFYRDSNKNKIDLIRASLKSRQSIFYNSKIGNYKPILENILQIFKHYIALFQNRPKNHPKEPGNIHY